MSSFKNLPTPFTIQNKLYKNIDKELVDKLYKLNQVNMEDLYNACDWKWNEKKERLVDIEFTTSRIVTKQTIALSHHLRRGEDNCCIFTNAIHG